MTRKRRTRHRTAGAGAGRTSAMWAVPTVLGYRLPMLWMMTFCPTPQRRREARRMVSEKGEAALEGALAMQASVLMHAQSFWLKAMSGRLTKTWLARAGKRILGAGAAPASRRLKANARRLGQRKGL
jgi:hypothetical protein